MTVSRALARILAAALGYVAVTDDKASSKIDSAGLSAQAAKLMLSMNAAAAIVRLRILANRQLQSLTIGSKERGRN